MMNFHIDRLMVSSLAMAAVGKYPIVFEHPHTNPINKECRLSYDPAGNDTLSVIIAYLTLYWIQMTNIFCPSFLDTDSTASKIYIYAPKYYLAAPFTNPANLPSMPLLTIYSPAYSSIKRIPISKPIPCNLLFANSPEGDILQIWDNMAECAIAKIYDFINA